jgi:hypothetical protein
MAMDIVFQRKKNRTEVEQKLWEFWAFSQR